MIKISRKHNKCSCDNCKKKKNKYRNIHSFVVADRNFNLCTECMAILSEKISNEFQLEFHDREETEEDIVINSKLRILFNRRVNNEWSEDCEVELQALDFESMRACDKVLYKQILNW